MLRCDKGTLWPGTFACIDTPSTGVDVAPLIGGISGGGIALAGVLFLLCMCPSLYTRQQKVESNSEDEEDMHEIQDALQQWWKCVQEVSSELCVFCGKNPNSFEFEENKHGPSTVFRCCTGCADILVPGHGLSCEAMLPITDGEEQPFREDSD